MNVMAQAHKMTKAEIRHQSEVDPRGEIEWMSYPQILKIMLRRCHAEFKTMQNQYAAILDANIHHFEIVNTHELNEGDIIRCHGMVVRIGQKQISDKGAHADNGHGVCHYHNSEILAARADMPQPGSRLWNVQGNRLARWSRWIG